MPDEQQLTTETQSQPVTVPNVPQGATLPNTPAPDIQPAQPTPENIQEQSALPDDAWDKFKAPAKPKEQPPVQQQEAKPDAPKPEEKKPQEQAKPEAKPPATDGDELPEGFLDDVEKNVPQKHLDLVKQRNKLAKHLRLSKGKEEQMQARIKELEGKQTNASPEKEAEYQKKIDALENDLKAQRTQAEEVRDRLYANELTARPDYQQHVVKPWTEVQNTIHSICKKYGQNPDDVWAAYQMEKADDRDNAFTEMMNSMTPMDQFKFGQAIEKIPAITQAQKALQANSKERLDAYRAADQQRQDREREGIINGALASSKAHYEQLKAAMPFLYAPEGDTPEVNAYKEAVAKTLNLSEQIAKRGVDKLSPEIQGRMVHDAVFADFIRNNIGGVLKQKDQSIKDLQTERDELKAANASLQDEIDSYRGAVPGGGGLPSSNTPAANGEPVSVSELVGRGSSLFPNWR